MIEIIDSGKEKKVMEEMVLMIGKKERKAFFVNGECITSEMAKNMKNASCPVVLYVQKKWGLLPDEKKALLYPLLWQKNVGAMAGYPFSIRELYRVYHALEAGNAVDNNYVIIAIRRGIVRELLSALSTSQSGNEKENALCRVKKEFGIHGTEEQIREKLKELANVAVSSLAPPLTVGKPVQGVFCDIEGTLLTDIGEINGKVRGMLDRLAEKRTRVTLWTSGDVHKARVMLGLKSMCEYPIISKRHYAGREVEIVVIIDGYDINTFRENHRIFPKRCIPVK